MKHVYITFVIILATLTLAAQSNYSPCYTNNMSKGSTAFSQGKYSEARTYYANAKQCAGGNPTEAQKKINACDAKIKAQREAAEAKRRAEAEAAEAKRKAEAEAAEAKRRAEEEAERKRQSELASSNKESEELEPPVMFTEEMPEYPGGPEALNAFITRELKYPEVARKNGITGTVLVEFVVEKDGSISNAKTKVPLFPDCDKEAIRCVMAMPKWKPGKSMGKPVRCSYQVPVTFRL